MQAFSGLSTLVIFLLVIMRLGATRPGPPAPSDRPGSSLAPRGIGLDVAQGQSSARLDSKSYLGGPAAKVQAPEAAAVARERKHHAVRAMHMSPPDPEQSKAHWERQWPRKPTAELPFRVFGEDRDSDYYWKGPSYDRQFWPECVSALSNPRGLVRRGKPLTGSGLAQYGDHGHCIPGTTVCEIPHNWSKELGKSHKKWGRPCRCENLDRCAVRKEEGYRDCDCPSETELSRWNYKTGKASL